MVKQIAIALSVTCLCGGAHTAYAFINPEINEEERRGRITRPFSPRKEALKVDLMGQPLLPLDKKLSRTERKKKTLTTRIARKKMIAERIAAKRKARLTAHLKRKITIIAKKAARLEEILQAKQGTIAQSFLIMPTLSEAPVMEIISKQVIPLLAVQEPKVEEKGVLQSVTETTQEAPREPQSEGEIHSILPAHPEGVQEALAEQMNPQRTTSWFPIHFTQMPQFAAQREGNGEEVINNPHAPRAPQHEEASHAATTPAPQESTPEEHEDRANPPPIEGLVPVVHADQQPRFAAPSPQTTTEIDIQEIEGQQERFENVKRDLNDLKDEIAQFEQTASVSSKQDQDIFSLERRKLVTFSRRVIKIKGDLASFESSPEISQTMQELTNEFRKIGRLARAFNMPTETPKSPRTPPVAPAELTSKVPEKKPHVSPSDACGISMSAGSNGFPSVQWVTSPVVERHKTEETQQHATQQKASLQLHARKLTEEPEVKELSSKQEDDELYDFVLLDADGANTL